MIASEITVTANSMSLAGNVGRTNRIPSRGRGRPRRRGRNLQRGREMIFFLTFTSK